MQKIRGPAFARTLVIGNPPGLGSRTLPLSSVGNALEGQGQQQGIQSWVQKSRGKMTRFFTWEGRIGNYDLWGTGKFKGEVSIAPAAKAMQQESPGEWIGHSSGRALRTNGVTDLGRLPGAVPNLSSSLWSPRGAQPLPLKFWFSRFGDRV